MPDTIFSAMADQLRPAPATHDDLLAKLAADEPSASTSTAATPAVTRAGRGWMARSSIAAAVTLIAGAALVAGPLMNSAPTAGGGPAAPDPAPAGQPNDYASLYTAVREASGSGATASREFAPASGGATENSAAGDTYATNTQVAGIDEGDVVKSDGSTVFIASGSEVVLVAAAGGDSRELARIDTTTGGAGPDRSADPTTLQGPVADLMLYGSTLVVMVTEYVPVLDQIPAGDTMPYVPFTASRSKALLYDIADPANPRFLASLGQSGAFQTSRLVDDVLYIVTNYVIANPDAANPDDPVTFVPSVTEGDRVVPLAPGDIGILPHPSGPTYAVVTSINLTTRTRIDSESVLGGSQVVYLNEQNVYLGGADHEEPLTTKDLPGAGLDSVPQVWGTRLARISLSDGQLDLAAQGSVPGTVINQFALDEYENHLRVAVTVSGAMVGGDAKGEQWFSQPALYVLDPDLTIVGSLPELATNESVQSVRFEGATGYVVSFEQVDPLFALDLRDPSKPVMMSSLKIPGFSTYLHPWSDGRLLGLGMNASNDGMVNGMKLSMFDTSDPFNVSELTTQKVAYDESEALYNHKAVLVDTEGGYIGFQASTWNVTPQDSGTPDQPTSHYLVYSYADGAFTLDKELSPRVPSAGYSVRGLTIDGNLYVASAAGVTVYSLDGFDELAAITLP